MKPESSEFESLFNTELSSTQKAALESVLFSQDYYTQPTPPPAPPQPPPPPPSVTPHHPPPPQLVSQNPNEPQVVTLDLTRKPGMQAGQQSPRNGQNRQRSGQSGRPQRSQRTQRPQRTSRRFDKDLTKDFVPVNRDEEYRKNRDKRRAAAKRNSIITKVLLAATGLVLMGTWVRCMMGTPAPTAEARTKTIKIGETAVPTDFVTNVHSDLEIISIEFANPPNFSAGASQKVEIIITDERDNFTVIESTLIVEVNREPPVIEGVVDILSTLNNPIIYRAGVTAHDDFGRELEFHVDSGEVNQHEVGEYRVRYWATDLTGNTTEVFAEVHILRVDIDYVFERVDSALENILKEGMTQLEMARAIHTWIRTNVSYAQGRSDPNTIYEDAYRALRDRQGNCYIFYAIGEVMLTRAGIPNMAINRIPGTPSRHRWSLINPDELGWHHFDTTPTRLGLGIETAFFTDAQARDFTRRFVDFNGTENFYTYNPEFYPQIVAS